MPACKQLYQDIAKDNQKVFLELAKKCYQDAEAHGKEKPDGQTIRTNSGVHCGIGAI